MELRRTDTFNSDLAAIRDMRARSTILVRLQRFASGNPGDVKPVGGGVSELRIDVGAGWRVYFTRVGAEVVALLCAGSKTTQAADISRAKLLAAGLKEARQ